MRDSVKLSHLCYEVLWLEQRFDATMVSVKNLPKHSCQNKERKQNMTHPDLTFKTKTKRARSSQAPHYIQRFHNNWVNDRCLWGELHKSDNRINWDGFSWWSRHTTVWVSQQSTCWPWATTRLHRYCLFLAHVTWMHHNFALLLRTQNGFCYVSVSLKQQVRSRCVSHWLISHSGVWRAHLREMNICVVWNGRPPCV